MKTKEQIIKQLEEGYALGMHKFYVNGLLFCLDREDLGIDCDDKLTERRFNKILEELKNGNI